MNTAAFISLYGLLFLLIAGYLARRGQSAATPVQFRLSWQQVWIWMALGIALRLPLLWEPGFHYDTNTYKAWALAGSDPENVLGVYRDGQFADHPPLYMYVLSALGAVARALGWEASSHFTALLKTPALVADALASALLLGELRKRTDDARALGLATLYWLNPALIFTGALWGQTDTILCLLVIAGWLAWTRKRHVLAAVIVAAAVAFKPLGALYAVVFGVGVIISSPWRVSIKAAVAGVLTYGAIVLPMLGPHDLGWLLSLYTQSPTGGDYITFSAYNLWALLGLGGRIDAGGALGLSLQSIARIEATIAIGAIAVWLGLRLRQHSDMESRGHLIAWAFALCTIALFMLAPGMHERYILAVLPALLLLDPARVRLPLILIWTVAALANIAYVYHHYIDLGSIAPQDTAFIRISAAANLLAAALTLLYWQSPGWPDRIRAWLPRPPSVLSPRAPSAPFVHEPWTGRHSLSVAALVLAALCIGLYRVGTTNFPVNGAISDGFSVEYRYTDPVDARYALIYTGEKALGDVPAKLSLQRFAGGEWVDVIEERAFNDFYHAYDIALSNPGPSTRYRWRTSAKDWVLNELALLDANGAPLLPAKALSSDLASDALAALTDEPDTWIRGRGYLASVYFDEIYHTRSGFEFLHQIRLYDHTHPPLGKVPIMLSIDAFGMHPFGWRFAGVLGSALTVGVLAWGGWLLAGSLRALLIAGALGLFEFSRFTIGRYGTIDGYLGLFILLSALLLWRAFAPGRHDDWRDGWRLSPTLLAAGAFLGAAIAVKWSAFYGGLGVFLFFCFSAGSGVLLGGPDRWRPLALRTVGAGVAFGIVPLAIYLASYTAFLRCMEGAPSLFSAQGFHEIIKSQQYIYSYHANLVDGHPFASAFWTWPINLKPLWIFTGEGQPRTAISILGNPAIWWGGLLVLIATVWDNMRAHQRAPLFLTAAWAALYLPWALVDRTAFNYHYYPAALILIVLVTFQLEKMAWRGGRWTNLPAAAVLLAGLMFVWFYPTISGHPAPDAWFKSLRWLPTWWML